MLLHRRDVFRVSANSEQATMHPRMQSLYASVHHFRKTRDVGDVAHPDPRIAQRLCGPTGADDLDVETAERVGEVNYPVLSETLINARRIGRS